MIIYKDVLTGDEIVSDSYGLKLVDDVVYEVDCGKVTVGGESFNVGGNPSAEGGDDEGVDDSATTVIDIIHNFRLQPSSFDTKSYLVYLKANKRLGKGYMKSIKKYLQNNGSSAEEIAGFEKNAAAYAKKIVKNFKDYDFYMGESNDVNGLIVLLNYREDGVTPFITVWKHGLSEEKV